MASEGARPKSSVKPSTTAAYEHGARGESSAAKTKGGRTAQARRRSASIVLTKSYGDDAYGFLDNVGKQTFGTGTTTPAAPRAAASAPTVGTTRTPSGGGATSFLNRRVGWNGSQLRAPQRAPSFTATAPSTGARFNKGTSARLIILAMGVAGVSIIFAGRNFKPYESKVGNKTVKVPGTLHAFAGLTIAGTIALIVNEVSAELGIVFAVGLGFLALTDAQAFAAWGSKVFGGGVPSSGTSKGGQSTGGATNFPVSPHALPQGGIWEPPGGVGSNAPGATGPGQGPVEVPPGSPSG
jgi:hypothetical protein